MANHLKSKNCKKCLYYYVCDKKQNTIKKIFCMTCEIPETNLLGEDVLEVFKR